MYRGPHFQKISEILSQTAIFWSGFLPKLQSLYTENQHCAAAALLVPRVLPGHALTQGSRLVSAFHFNNPNHH
jgi:hypothetical protein